MSGNPLNFIGKLDRKEEALLMPQLQQKAFLDKLMGGRDPHLVQRMYGIKRVRDVYTPPTRGLDGSSVVMSKN